jgi:hypothetical protein
MTWMASPEPLRDEGLDEVANQLLSRPTEESLGLGIDQDDVSVSIDDHDGIRG